MQLEKAFSHALKQARARAHLSQEQLALASGLDRTYVSLLERGLRQPSLTTIFAIANALSIKPEDLILRVREAVDENN